LKMLGSWARHYALICRRALSEYMCWFGVSNQTSATHYPRRIHMSIL
jgi:hypothetical protein